MTPQEIHAELESCLKLQNEITAKHDQLILRFKAVLDACESQKRRVIVDIGGEIYELMRTNFTTVPHEEVKKYGGFYGSYRLVKIGKPIT